MRNSLSRTTVTEEGDEDCMKKLNKTDVRRTGHQIALYVRVSTDEQAENPEGSIKSQEQRLRSQVDQRNSETYFGEIVGVYIDRAKSGKDTNRPELQRLLQTIQRKEITLVMVTELSRLSRSIKDFSEIWELMRANGCEFLSLREQFDTTSAAGEMVIYTIANIAQFERKQCSERVAANFLARAKRGLFNGGAVPLGYRIHPEKRGSLEVDTDGAAIVCEAFRTFLNEGFLSAAGKSLNDRGYRLPKKRPEGGGRTRLGHFTIENLYKMLTNRAYLGVRRYKEKGKASETQASWPPLIDALTFERVQQRLKQNGKLKTKAPTAKRYPYLLSGAIGCGKCGNVLSGKSANGNGGKIPYYEHSWATRRQSCLNKDIFRCEPHRIPARRLEPAVWGEILKLLSDPGLARSLIDEAKSIHATQSQTTELDRLRGKIRGVEEQIEALAEHLSKIPKTVSPAPIYRQMERLEALKAEATSQRDNLAHRGGSDEMPVAFRDYRSFLGVLKAQGLLANAPDTQAKVIRQLIHQVEVLPGAFRLHYLVGKSHFEQLAKDGAPEGAPSFFRTDGSKSLKNGAGYRARTDDLHVGNVTL